MLENSAIVPVLSTAGTGLIIAFSILANWWGRARPPKPEATPSRDVMIPAVAVADGQLIADQIRVLREANDHAKNRHQFEQEIITIFREMLIFQRQIASDMNESRHSLERIERNQNPPSPGSTRR